MHPSEHLDWDKTLRSLGSFAPQQRCSPFWFGNTEALSNDLCTLVMAGKKTATASLLWEWEFEQVAVPEQGEVHVLLDWSNTPLGILTNTQVDVVPFNRVSADFAVLEGEGDLSLEWWQQAHWRYFEGVCANLDRTTTEDMPVVCQVFEFSGL